MMKYANYNLFYYLLICFKELVCTTVEVAKAKLIRQVRRLETEGRVDIAA